MKNDNYYEIANKYYEFLQWNFLYNTIENFINFLFDYNYNYKIFNNDEKIKKMYEIINNYLDDIS